MNFLDKTAKRNMTTSLLMDLFFALNFSLLSFSHSQWVRFASVRLSIVESLLEVLYDKISESKLQRILKQTDRGIEEEIYVYMEGGEKRASGAASQWDWRLLSFYLSFQSEQTAHTHSLT